MTEPNEVASRQRLLILCVCCMSLLLTSMDNSIVNVALPSIGDDLHASVSGLQWTVDSYTLVIAAFLLMSGSTADRFGRRRTFQIGLVTFTLGSLLCSLAPGVGWLVGFRMVQALGGSMLNPVAMSIIINVFTDTRGRTRAIGVWGAVAGVGLGLGPVVGGLLTQTIGWRSIFWINVPIGVTAVVLTAIYVPESRARHARRVDPFGQVLLIAVLLSVSYAIIDAPDAGWRSVEVVALFAFAAIAVMALLVYEPRQLEPLIDVRLFGSRPFTGATLIAVCAFGIFSGFLLLSTLYLQNVRGLSALDTGLLLLPVAVMTMLVAPVSGRIVGSRGPRLPLVIASVAMTVAVALLTQLSNDTSYGWLLLSYTTLGFGLGLIHPPITNTAVSGLPRSQAGVAAALASTSRQIGAALGVAVVGSIVVAHGGLVTASLAEASHAAWWLLTGVGLVMLILATVTTTPRASASAVRTAHLLTRPPGTPAARASDGLST